MSKLEIPASWAKAKLGDFLRIKRGASPRPVGDPKYFGGDGKCGWLKISDITRQGKYIVEVKEFVTTAGVEKSVYVPPGDLVLSNSATIGLPAIIKIPVCIHDGFLTFPNLPKEVDIDFFYNFFLAFRSTFQAKSVKGATQANLNLDIVSKIECPLPPTDEQRRIASKIESTQEKIKIIKESVLRAEKLTGKFREALLEKAFRGELIAQDPNDEPASKLLERIRADSIKQTDSKKKKKHDLPPIEAEEIPFEIPKSWEWIRLGEVIDLINGDRGANYPNVSEYVNAGVAWVNAGHIQPDGSLAEDQMHYITRKKFDSLRSGKIKAGDLVYCLRGALGKTAFVTPYLEGAVASSLVILRPSKHLNKFFLYNFLTSTLGRQLISRFDNGSAQPNLSAKSVALYVFPLPSVREQERIVAEINRRRQQLSSLESIFSLLGNAVGKVSGSILASAFSGQLVEQDPSEGTGHELLAKINQVIPLATSPSLGQSAKHANGKKKKRTKE